jgi:hypothetical protein
MIDYDIMKNTSIIDKWDMVPHIITWSLISNASIATNGTCCSVGGVISDMRHDHPNKADETGHMVMMKPKSTTKTILTLCNLVFSTPQSNINGTWCPMLACGL